MGPKFLELKSISQFYHCLQNSLLINNLLRNWSSTRCLGSMGDIEVLGSQMCFCWNHNLQSWRNSTITMLFLLMRWIKWYLATFHVFLGSYLMTYHKKLRSNLAIRQKWPITNPTKYPQYKWAKLQYIISLFKLLSFDFFQTIAHQNLFNLLLAPNCSDGYIF